jgi:hypothetical protein
MFEAGIFAQAALPRTERSSADGMRMETTFVMESTFLPKKSEKAGTRFGLFSAHRDAEFACSAAKTRYELPRRFRAL